MSVGDRPDVDDTLTTPNLVFTPSAGTTTMAAASELWPSVTEEIVDGCRVRVLPGRQFPAFSAGEAGTVTRADAASRTCDVLFDDRPSGPVLVAMRHLCPETKVGGDAVVSCAPVVTVASIPPMLATEGGEESDGIPSCSEDASWDMTQGLAGETQATSDVDVSPAAAVTEPVLSRTPSHSGSLVASRVAALEKAHQAEVTDLRRALDDALAGRKSRDSPRPSLSRADPLKDAERQVEEIERRAANVRERLSPLCQDLDRLSNMLEGQERRAGRFEDVVRAMDVGVSRLGNMLEERHGTTFEQAMDLAGRPVASAPEPVHESRIVELEQCVKAMRGDMVAWSAEMSSLSARSADSDAQTPALWQALREIQELVVQESEQRAAALREVLDVVQQGLDELQSEQNQKRSEVDERVTSEQQRLKQWCVKSHSRHSNRISVLAQSITAARGGAPVEVETQADATAQETISQSQPRSLDCPVVVLQEPLAVRTSLNAAQSVQSVPSVPAVPCMQLMPPVVRGETETSCLPVPDALWKAMELEERCDRNPSGSGTSLTTASKGLEDQGDTDVVHAEGSATTESVDDVRERASLTEAPVRTLSLSANLGFAPVAPGGREPAPQASSTVRVQSMVAGGSTTPPLSATALTSSRQFVQVECGEQRCGQLSPRVRTSSISPTPSISPVRSVSPETQRQRTRWQPHGSALCVQVETLTAPGVGHHSGTSSWRSAQGAMPTPSVPAHSTPWPTDSQRLSPRPRAATQSWRQVEGCGIAGSLGSLGSATNSLPMRPSPTAPAVVRSLSSTAVQRSVADPLASARELLQNSRLRASSSASGLKDGRGGAPGDLTSRMRASSSASALSDSRIHGAERYTTERLSHNRSDRQRASPACTVPGMRPHALDAASFGSAKVGSSRASLGAVARSGARESSPQKLHLSRV